ncbi:alpha/beta fold hydrolase [Salinispira pacifica]
MKLHLRDLSPPEGTGLTPVMILHGLFGSGDNWLAFGKTLADSRRVVLPDLPNHGDSPHTDRFSYGYMAALLADFMRAEGLAPCVLTGHSMGGKIAMAVALEQPELVERLCLVDIAPVTDPARHSEILAAMDEVAEADVRSRREAEEIMKRRIPKERERLFLQKSLVEGEDGVYRWKLNLPLIRESYRSMLEWPYDPADGYRYDGPVLFVAGERSGYVKQEYMEAARRLFPRSRLARVPDAGHWVHAERPDQFGELFRDFLAEES